MLFVERNFPVDKSAPRLYYCNPFLYVSRKAARTLVDT